MEGDEDQSEEEMTSLTCGSDVFSPYSHLTVHHTRKVKLSQQILHLVVLLPVLLYISVVAGDKRTEHILHQEGQAALLAVTVFLKDNTS